MSRPYVCAACRNGRFLSSQIALARQGRQFSSSVRRQNERGFESPYAEWGTRSQSEYSGEEYTANVFGEQRNEHIPKPRAGRYSGQPLRPAHLLDELNQAPQQRSPAAEPQNYDRHQQSEYPRGGPVEEVGTQPDIQTRVREISVLFADLVEQGHWPAAWDCLKETHKLYSGLDAQVLSTLKHHPRDDILLKFRVHCVKNWALALERPLKKTSHDRRLPGPVKMKQLMIAVGWHSSTSWSGLLWQVSLAVHSYRATHADLQPRQLLPGIRELVGLWQLCLNSGKLQSEFIDDTLGEEPARDLPWALLPSAEALNELLRDVRVEHPFNRLLVAVFHHPTAISYGRTSPPGDDANKLLDYASPALLTIDLLRALPVPARDSSEFVDTHSHENQPLFDFLEEALRTTSPVTVPPRMLKQLKPRWANPHRLLPVVQRLNVAVNPELVAQIQEWPGYQRPESTGAHEVFLGGEQTSEMHTFTQVCINRLTRARQANNFHLAQRVKHDITEMAEKNQRAGKAPPPLDLYEHLMLVLLLLGHPKRAMEVWETVIRTGFLPTVKTYTVMLRGARGSRDATGMQAFWANMRKAGIQPDTPAWTAYIHGLIKLRCIDQGLDAVKEMGREWLAAAQEQAALDQRAAGGSRVSPRPASNASLLTIYPASVRGVPRPDVSILNCAITALADTRDRAIPEVVNWARTFGIEPDIITYNTLLNIAMRGNQTKNATALLASMKERSIAPNGDTWVVLLAAMFQNGFLNDVARDKQLEKVLAWVDSTRATDGSTTVDSKGFALIIDRFVKQLRNPDAATGVLLYMAKNDIKFSIHMATIVLTSYFEEDPPNFDAVDALWQRLTDGDLNAGKDETVGSLDTVFYDRLIEGYARYHYLIGLRPCLDVLNRCQREGRKPGWRALEQVARAMAAKNRYDLLRDLVVGIRARLRQGHGGTQLQGQRGFWQFVISTGILEQEGIRRPEDLLPRDGPRLSPMANSLSSEEAAY
jgi:pentatricopeptide repeat protein